MAKQTAIKPTEENTSSQLSRKTEFKETILIRNPDSGRVDVLSSIDTKAVSPRYTTVEPTLKNKAAFYEFREGTLLADFIQKLRAEQKQNNSDAKPTEYYLVPYNEVSRVGALLQKYHTNPTDDECIKVRNSYRTSADQLAKVIYPLSHEVISDLKSLGLDVDTMYRSGELRTLTMGLESSSLYPIHLKEGNHTIVNGEYAIRLNRDEHDIVTVNLDSPLRVPEFFKNPELTELITDKEKHRLQAGLPLGRPLTHDGETCLAAMSPLTMRMIYVPIKDITIPSFKNSAWINQQNSNELSRGGEIRLQNCAYSMDKENKFEATAYYDPIKRELMLKDHVFSKPFIPEHIKKQIPPSDYNSFIAGDKILKGNEIFKKDGKKHYLKDICFNPRTNTVEYVITDKETQQKTQAQRESQKQTPQQTGKGRTISSSL